MSSRTAGICVFTPALSTKSRQPSSGMQPCVWCCSSLQYHQHDSATCASSNHTCMQSSSFIGVKLARRAAAPQLSLAQV